MARVVVVGGGYGGLAVAARLAKQHHAVTLVERSPTLGGALRPVLADGFAWDGSATTTLLPAVLRDLFRKTGRPLEAELDLAPVSVLREHRFVDGSRLALPGASRHRQRAALDDLDPGLGEPWTAYVDGFAETWETLRRGYLETVWDPSARTGATADTARARAVLDARGTLRRHVRARLRDDRLVDVATYPAVAEGHDPRDVPAWAGLVSWLEQCFGAWRVVGGTGRLVDALDARLATRGVTVETGTEVTDLDVRSGRVVGVRTRHGVLDADLVVCAIDPRRIPALAAGVERTMPAMPPYVVHLGLEGDPLPEVEHELVVHGDPLITVRRGTAAPSGRTAWTLLGRGALAEDPVLALARGGVDLRPRVVARVDRSPRTLVEEWGGSPLGVRWAGRRTVRARLGPRTPIGGVYAVGAHATPGSGLPFVGLSAAQVAAAVADDAAPA